MRHTSGQSDEIDNVKQLVSEALFLEYDLVKGQCFCDICAQDISQSFLTFINLPQEPVRTCILAYLHTYILTYLHTYILAYLHTYILAYMCIIAYIFIHVYLHTCIRAYLHKGILAYLHTCILVYLHTWCGVVS